MNPTDAVGAAAVACSFVFVWPQVVRLARSKDADGISVRGAAWTCVGFSLWVGYGLRKAIVPVWAANGQALVGFAIIITMALRWGPSVPRLAPMIAGFAAGVLAITLGLPAVAVGWIAVVIGSTAFLPQAWVALTSTDLSGVSVATYALVALTSGLFLLYGALRHDIVLLAPNIVSVPAGAVIAVRAHRYQALNPAG